MTGQNNAALRWHYARAQALCGTVGRLEVVDTRRTGEQSHAPYLPVFNFLDCVCCRIAIGCSLARACTNSIQ